MPLFSALVVIFVAGLASVSGRGMVGGFGEVQSATPDEQEILDTVRDSVEKQLDVHFPEFKAVFFATQVVAGTNYIIAVNTGDEFLHVKIGKPLPFKKEPPFLMSIRRGVTEDTPIDPQLM